MEKKHNFLYYIFQFDKKQCIMNEKKESKLKNFICHKIRLFFKGE